jgi:hypothetical protein
MTPGTAIYHTTASSDFHIQPLPMKPTHKEAKESQAQLRNQSTTLHQLFVITAKTIFFFFTALFCLQVHLIV